MFTRHASMFLVLFALVAFAQAGEDGIHDTVSAKSAASTAQDSPSESAKQTLSCGDPDLCAPRRRDIRDDCRAKSAIGCVVRPCDAGGFHCVPRFSACENKCRASEARTTKRCGKYAVLGCSVNACFRKKRNGSGAPGFACTAGPATDFRSTSSICLNPLTYSAFYNNGYDWPDRIIPSLAVGTVDGKRVYALFDCTECTSNISRNVGQLLNNAGVTVAQVMATCPSAGLSSNGSKLFDCSGTFLQELLPALLGCE